MMKKILMFFFLGGGWTPVKAEKTYYLDVNGVLDGSWEANI